LIPLQDDYRKGEKLERQAETLSFAELVRYYWSLPTYPPTPPDLSARFIRHVLTDEERINGYKDKIGSGRAFLDVGCGTAALVKVAQARFDLAVGCDVAFRWLVVARKRLQQAGLRANLICCCADYLPFPEGFFDTVGSVSLLEHVSNAEVVIRECGRVVRKNGRVFVWSSNRFSLAPEPHVRVWGVGFLPRRLMPAYVKWRRGMAYNKKRLLSCFEMRSLFKKAGFGSAEFSLPVITKADWENLRGFERLGARVFSWAAGIPLLREVLIVVSPVIQALAERQGAPAAGSRTVPLEVATLAK
jgi:ubiquinone/menaquinone biosynthesis C-methylase UbiE